VRGFVFGLILIFGASLTVLSVRPGGLRRQLRLVARRLRIVLVLGGVYVFGSLGIRLAFPTGPVLDYGPPVLAVLLLIVYVIVARDPVIHR
jgi:hypothetical protein